MSRAVSNSEDIVDSRDIVARFNELENELHAVHADEHKRVNDDPDLSDEDRATVPDPVNLDEWIDYVLGSPDGHLYESEAEEYKVLKELIDDINSIGGDSAKDGVTLIRDSYFKSYAQEFADDIGAVNRESGWPNSCIDWDQAADELQTDYTSIEWDGVTYWGR